MHRVGKLRILLIIFALILSVTALVPQKIDVSFLGLNLNRGSDSLLGMRLGLDLQGGILLIYQARGTKNIDVTFESTVNTESIQSILTNLGKSDAIIEKLSENSYSIQFDTLSTSEQQSIEAEFGNKLSTIESLKLSDIPAVPTSEQMEGVQDIITRRINPFGISEPEIQLMGNNRILVQLPGIKDVSELKRLIGQTARLEFKQRTCLSNGPVELPSGAIGDLCDLPENYKDEDVGLTGDDLARAYPGTNPNTGLPVVHVEFKSRGAKIFKELTTKLAGTTDRFAVFLDNEQIIAPTVEQPILAGRAIIEGRTLTASRVRTVSIQLESGRLPIPLEVIHEQDVDATLGAESLKKSLIAGIVGLALVLSFMIFYYKIPGIIAAMALIIYTAVVLSIFKLVPITLTLGGVGAFILSIGMAVDANILIFERMKEELRIGRTLHSAIEIGFNRAWSAIRDANVSTLITSGILIWFGHRLATPILSGFGTVLAIGIVTSLFSAIFVTKILLKLLATSSIGHSKSWFTPESRSIHPQSLISQPHQDTEETTQ